uniref:Uncharacterized protein n=1 Tax=Anguilla anguilla TaxID=7936 RepID=A0A0E9W4D4_ANGAN
MNILYLKETLI